MASVEELTERLRAEVARNPLRAGSMRFDLGADGSIRAEGDQVTNDATPADCTLVAKKADFDRMLSGALDPRAALMDGTFVVEGDLSVILALQPTIRTAWQNGAR